MEMNDIAGLAKDLSLFISEYSETKRNYKESIIKRNALSEKVVSLERDIVKIESIERHIEEVIKERNKLRVALERWEARVGNLKRRETLTVELAEMTKERDALRGMMRRCGTFRDDKTWKDAIGRENLLSDVKQYSEELKAMTKERDVLREDIKECEENYNDLDSVVNDLYLKLEKGLGEHHKELKDMAPKRDILNDFPKGRIKRGKHHKPNDDNASKDTTFSNDDGSTLTVVWT